MDRHIGLFVLLACSFPLIWGQPVADFSANTTSGCAPLIVNFQNQSIGDVSWSWDFGVGTSSLSDPGALYLNPGSYDVRLIVWDGNGQSDTIVKQDFIQVFGMPQAQFGVDQTAVCAHTGLNFTDQSNAGSGQIVSWAWDFGDGTTSNDQNPVHSYTDAGLYQVSLVVANQFGCQDNIIVGNYIDISAPDPDFTADQLLACGPPLEVSFSSTGTGIAQHYWDFGDGNTSSQSSPVNTYGQFGNFDVRHIAEDAQGCRDTLIKSSYINIGINTISVFADDSSICVGDTIFFFTNASSNTTVTWDFGDGTTGSGLEPFHIYSQPGQYTATADITDPGGCSVMLTIPVEAVAYPVVDFHVVDTTLGCEVPFTVEFVNQTVGASSYVWQFGDGTSSMDPNPVHTYTSVDSFNVRLKAFTQEGCMQPLMKFNYIKVNRVDAGFVTDKKGGCVALDVEFLDTTSSPYPLVSWDWKFGDGTTSSLQHPYHTYSDTGYFDVELIATNTRGCSDTVYKSSLISVGEVPNVDFAVDTNVACAYAPVQFINQSTGAQDYIWYFGDGDTAMATNPSHGFGALGYMDVLLIGNDRGCTDTLYQPGMINILAPLPIMALSDRKVCELPKDVQFDNLSIGDDSWTWVLDNSIVNNDLSWTHTFTSEGSYTVKLTVSSSTTGCAVTATDSVVVKTVEASFVPDTNRGCHPLTIEFEDESYNAIWWKWDFGNNDSSDVAAPSTVYRDTGLFIPQLIVKNSINCRDTFEYSSIYSLGTTADFSITTDSNGCVPFEVLFEDESEGTGGVVQWEWDMGDSNYYHVQNPSHTYYDQNYYSVQLKVVDEDGCVDSISKSQIVHATQPVPDFVVNPPVNCDGVFTTFTNLSEGIGLSYAWEFGDGNTSNQSTVNHSYDYTGVFDVTLTVTDVNGCDSSLTINDAVTISDIYAAFTLDTNYAACPPLEVYFEADTAFPHAGIEYHWDFGDGAISSQSHPSHIYTLPGVYDVRLIIETPTGCTDTMIMSEVITVEGPTAEFTAFPLEGCPGTEVSFSAESEFDVDFEWVFGDGTTSSGPNYSHTYHIPGQYTPVLVVEDSTGCRVFHVGQDQVEIFSPPEAGFSIDDSILCDSGLVVFSDRSGGQSPLTDWYWEFGDGATDTIPSPSHFFTEVGEYSIRLTLTDYHGCRDTLERDALIHVFPSPEPSILASDTAGCPPFRVNAFILDPDHEASIIDYSWNLGNGATANSEFVHLILEETGEKWIQATIIDEHGCSGGAGQEFIIHSIPGGTFFASDSFGCSPFEVEFAVSSPDSLIGWNWSFGDGAISTEENPVNRYQKDGIYDVQVEITDTNHCSIVLDKAKYINLKHPTADFEISDPIVCQGEELEFWNQSQSDTTLIGFTWQFGDGETSTEENPSYAYASWGDFDIELIVEDVFGCTDTVVQSGYLTVLENIEPDPVAIQVVSVINEREISVKFDAYHNLRNDFGKYVIYRKEEGGNYILAGEITEVEQTEFIDELEYGAIEDHVHCYQVLVLNRCGLSHDLALADEHCTVDLRTEAGNERVDIYWTPYIGWDHIEAYLLYRVNDYDPGIMELIGTFGGDIYQFTDLDMFCYEDYSYRVEAIGARHMHSYSDTAFANPYHPKPDSPSHVLKVTVENNAYISVEWEAAIVEDATRFVLEKGRRGKFETVFEQDINIPNQKYQDPEVAVSEASYIYRAFTVDTCGDFTPLGRTGNSILLRTEPEGSRVNLEWNAYEGWPDGVKAYRIEVYDEESGLYTQVARVGGQTTHYIDESTIERPQANNCYRIIAEGEHDEMITSTSNDGCTIMEPRIYSPNAFTPNGDGLNDEFLLQGLFLQEFHLSIFNRWGHKIFESHQEDIGWDGVTMDGKKAPEGVYVYVLEGIGHSGTPVKKVGSINLLR